MNCPICLASKVQRIYSVYDDRYGHPGQFDIACCQICGHIYVSGYFSAEHLTHLYSKYYPRSSFDVSQHIVPQEENGFWAWFDGEKKSTFRWIPRNVTILDIGCGFCEALAYHTARGCRVYGTDADLNIQQVVDKYGYKVTIGLFDPELYQRDFFDYITLDQVMEHLIDPVGTLQSIAQILKPGGRVVLSTPNAHGWGVRSFGGKWINWHVPYHTQFFSKKSMLLASEKAGLELKMIRTITSSKWLLYQWIHLLTYPRQGVSSVFWDTKKKRSARDKLLVKVLSLVHKTTINHLITRLFDTLGMGDNFVIVLRKP